MRSAPSNLWHGVLDWLSWTWPAVIGIVLIVAGLVVGAQMSASRRARDRAAAQALCDARGRGERAGRQEVAFGSDRWFCVAADGTPVEIMLPEER